MSDYECGGAMNGCEFCLAMLDDDVDERPGGAGLAQRGMSDIKVEVDVSDELEAMRPVLTTIANATATTAGVQVACWADDPRNDHALVAARAEALAEACALARRAAEAETPLEAAMYAVAMDARMAVAMAMPLRATKRGGERVTLGRESAGEAG